MLATACSKTERTSFSDISESETAEEEALEEAELDALVDCVADDVLADAADEEDDPPPHAVSVRAAHTMHETSATMIMLVRFTRTPLCCF